MDANTYTPERKTGDNPKELFELKRIAEEYEAAHPGVDIQFNMRAPGDFETWLTASLKGDVAPDIVWAHAEFCNERAQYGWFVNLDPYLEEPNPYVPGNERWFDQFYKDATDARRAPNGHLYIIPVDQVATAMFYNKDIFARAGIEKIPETWAEFLDVQKQLKKKGENAFCMTAGGDFMRLNWAWRIITDQLYNGILDEIDVRKSSAGGFAGVDAEEFVRAYRKGIISAHDDRFLEYFRIMKEWSQYWQDGFLGTGDDLLFRLGEAAIWWDGSWYVDMLERDPMREFEFGTFAVPLITKETSPFASGFSRGVGGATANQYAITSTAVRKGNVDLAVDFLRFITAPRNLGPMVAEAAMYVPNVKGVDINPKLAGFAKKLEAGHVLFGEVPNSKIFNDHWGRTMQSYLGGQYTLDDVAGKMEAYLEAEVERLLRQNEGVWEFTEDWDIVEVPNAPEPERLPTTSEIHYFGVFMLVVLALALGAMTFRRDPLTAWRAAWKKRMVYFFILPTFFLLFAFSYYPVVAALLHAFTRWTGAGQAEWIGLRNFGEVFTDPVIRESAWNMIQLTVVGILLGVTVPLFAAELIFNLKSDRAKYIYRVLFVVPMVVPGVVMLLIWQLMYDYNLGLFNRFFNLIGLGMIRPNWLGDPRIALYSLMLLGFPWVGGFGLLIYYAGLQNIPQSVLESAQLDGARGFTRFRYFDFPLVMGQVKLMIVFSVIGTIQGFQTQLILTGGGPGYSTMVPGLHMFHNAITFDRMGYACGIGTVLFLIILTLTYINLRYLRSSTEYEAG